MIASSVKHWVTPWMDEAYCADFPIEWWYPSENGGSTPENRDAISICKQCPVQTECLEFALATDDRYGIFGGTTPQQRYEITHNKPLRKDNRWLR